MKLNFNAFVYEVHFAVAEFGECDVVIKANDRKDADRKIDEWCEKNYAVSSTSLSGIPKPFLKCQAVFG